MDFFSRLFVTSDYVKSVVNYSLDPETKDQLIEVLERLLGDKTTVSTLYNLCDIYS